MKRPRYILTIYRRYDRHEAIVGWASDKLSRDEGIRRIRAFIQRYHAQPSYFEVRSHTCPTGKVAGC